MLIHLPDIFPLQLNWIVNTPFKAFIDIDKALPQFLERLKIPLLMGPDTIAQRSLPKSTSIKVLKIMPRLGEGSAYVKFSHDPSESAKEIDGSIKQYLEDNPIRPWFNPFWRVRCYTVRGRPWLEDLYRAPTPKVKVEFVPTEPGQPAQELGQEALYSLFRRYGKLSEIVPQPTDSKDLPKYALLDFNKTRYAVTAKNCMHGYIVPASEGGGEAGTILKISYQRKKGAPWAWSWLVNHPRIMLPLILALLGTVTVAIFDPYVWLTLRC